MNTHTKNGQLTAYGYACGYLTRHTRYNESKELYKEGGVYHVRYKDISELYMYGMPQSDTNHKFKIWETFDTLTQAKKRFNSIKLIN